MGGIFGVVSRKNCIDDLFYGTDYQSHLGTEFAGLVVLNGNEINPFIRDIRNNSFRSRFMDFVSHVSGDMGVGVISDYEPQPLLFDSPFGAYALAHVGKIGNLEELAEKQSIKKNRLVKIRDKEFGGDKISPIGVIANLIDSGKNIVDGLEIAQNSIEGSASLALLKCDGIYVARDKLGRTPLVIGRKDGITAVSSETCAFPTNGFKTERFLGPGEIGILTEAGYQQLKKPEEDMQICSFLWVYYGQPASVYEGRNSEVVRNKCGKALAIRDKKRGIEIDLVAGIPDSGTAHAIGYANESKIDFARPYVKYSETWQRSFMPQEQKKRQLVAEMKLIPIRELIEGKSLLFCDDSLVRGTQLKNKIAQLFEYGAKEVHVRPACPPLIFGCEFLNFSRPSKYFDLAAKRAIAELEGLKDSSRVRLKHVRNYLDEDSVKHSLMVKNISQEIKATSLYYQRLDDLVSAIGLPKNKLCTYCWDGCKGCKKV